MSEEILINLTPRETRVAVVENGVLLEVFVERERKRGLVGNIYKGKVVRVLPGMDAAFVDIGLERAAFLHVSDIVKDVPAPSVSVSYNGYTENNDGNIHIHENELSIDHLSVGNILIKQPNMCEENMGSVNSISLDANSDNSLNNNLDAKPIPTTPINQLVRQGQTIVVQVIKDPLGTKGARLTTHLSIPSRYLVFLADSDMVGVSVRIDNDAERNRLKDIIQTFKEELGTGGYIVRTAGEGVDPWAIRADMQFLQRIWASLQEKIQLTHISEMIYSELPLELRVIRDFINDKTDIIKIDSRAGFQKMSQFAQQFLPEALSKLTLYKGERPLFDIHNIEDEIERTLHKKVALKSGGYLMIEQTEAMTTIDVNTGAYVGHKNLSETIFKTNLEAAQTIAHQLRLRNLGGIIILDFIDMNNEEHKQGVLDALNQNLAKDHAKTSVGEVTNLGLVQMTRKRTRESLEHILCGKCPTCEGRGFIKTVETVCYQIFREIIQESKKYPSVKQFLILASPDVIGLMLEEESNSVAELEIFINASLRLQSESLYNPEQFDIVLM